MKYRGVAFASVITVGFGGCASLDGLSGSPDSSARSDGGSSAGDAASPVDAASSTPADSGSVDVARPDASGSRASCGSFKTTGPRHPGTISTLGTWADASSVGASDDLRARYESSSPDGKVSLSGSAFGFALEKGAKVEKILVRLERYAVGTGKFQETVRIHGDREEIVALFGQGLPLEETIDELDSKVAEPKLDFSSFDVASTNFVVSYELTRTAGKGGDTAILVDDFSVEVCFTTP